LPPQSTSVSSPFCTASRQLGAADPSVPLAPPPSSPPSVGTNLKSGVPHAASKHALKIVMTSEIAALARSKAQITTWSLPPNSLLQCPIQPNPERSRVLQLLVTRASERRSGERLACDLHHPPVPLDARADRPMNEIQIRLEQNFVGPKLPAPKHKGRCCLRARAPAARSCASLSANPASRGLAASALRFQRVWSHRCRAPTSNDLRCRLPDDLL
jgi:hypothetical protein